MLCRAVPCRGPAGGTGQHGMTSPPGAEPAGQRPGKVPAQGISPTGSLISQPRHCLCHTLSLFEQQIIVSNFSGFQNSSRGKASRGRRCRRCRTGQQRGSCTPKHLPCLGPRGNPRLPDLPADGDTSTANPSPTGGSFSPCWP